ncbi:hypothetical protein [Vibrio ostreae]|uniref:MSHA biogenesis protein MshK n=1 Tax=Vibrio ostreae TaxID=2841925 RepID=A0A975U9X4_9VIBR|nr:hypothetical protein [Vibrio ostreae]QXO17630.1 hypothetical protein KNV97_20145 [Vibrio ostreae]
MTRSGMRLISHRLLPAVLVLTGHCVFAVAPFTADSLTAETGPLTGAEAERHSAASNPFAVPSTASDASEPCRSLLPLPLSLRPENEGWPAEGSWLLKAVLGNEQQRLAVIEIQAGQLVQVKVGDQVADARVERIDARSLWLVLAENNNCNRPELLRIKMELSAA